MNRLEVEATEERWKEDYMLKEKEGIVAPKFL